MKINDLKETIAETLEYILLNPAIFFSEADVQSIFYHRLIECPDLGLLIVLRIFLYF